VGGEADVSDAETKLHPYPLPLPPPAPEKCPTCGQTTGAPYRLAVALLDQVSEPMESPTGRRFVRLRLRVQGEDERRNAVYDVLALGRPTAWRAAEMLEAFTETRADPDEEEVGPDRMKTWEGLTARVALTWDDTGRTAGWRVKRYLGAPGKTETEETP
jgi:hypothetical protein